MISSFCLSMISAQTLRVCREEKPVPTFPDHTLEEASTHIQAGGRHAQEYNEAKAANHSRQTHNEAGFRFGSGARGNFWNRMHLALSN
jgi:hypothetical protein